MPAIAPLMSNVHAFCTATAAGQLLVSSTNTGCVLLLPKQCVHKQAFTSLLPSESPFVCSIALLSEDQEYSMDIATLGLPRQVSSVQRLHATSDQSTAHHHLVNSDQMFMSWQATSGSPIPLDWLQLHVHGGT
jgi:hypothetical protein